MKNRADIELQAPRRAERVALGALLLRGLGRFGPATTRQLAAFAYYGPRRGAAAPTAAQLSATRRAVARLRGRGAVVRAWRSGRWFTYALAGDQLLALELVLPSTASSDIANEDGAAR